MTAKIIPNGILIATNTSTHIFASFLSRDQAYDQIMKIWDLNKKASSVIPLESNTLNEEDEETDDADSMHSTQLVIKVNTPPLLITHDDSILQHSNINQQAADTDGTVTPVGPAITTTHVSTSTNNANVDIQLSPPINNSNSPTNKSITLAAINTSQNEQQQRPRAVSDSYTRRDDASMEPNVRSSYNTKHEIGDDVQPATVLKKTRVCPCTIHGQQYFHVALNETYSGTVEAIFELLFNSEFYKNFLEQYENFEDLQLGEWKHGNRQVTGKRIIKSSTKGTKIIKILFKDKRIHKKYPYYCCVTTHKSMPDMPMGAVYSIQSRTCITRVHKDKVHVLITFQVVFSKSGLVSSIIEKNAADDQLRLYNHLNLILKKPILVRELTSNKRLLEALHMIEQTRQIHSESKDSRIAQVIESISSIKLINFIYATLFLVLMTHCLLALRLQRITQYLEVVQRHQSRLPYASDHNAMIKNPQWINQGMETVCEHLSQLKDKVQDYNQRVSQLKNNI
ncbi:MAG: hypothetical protein EXX96DRAFT_552337 [Benjaminiella poitrasii]|nr:MAG: hypothetical protein EXX96DRAFT_552337 [Benjaminiella poitrasii]